MNKTRLLPVLAVLSSLVLAMPSLAASHAWLFGSADGRDGDGGMRLHNTSATNGNWSVQGHSLRFENRFAAQTDDNNSTQTLATLDLSAFGYQAGSDFTLWLMLDIHNVFEWNRFGLVAFMDDPEHADAGMISARTQVLNRGLAEIAMATDFTGRRGELIQQALPERLTNDRYRMILTGEHQADGSLRLTFSLQRGDDDTPHVINHTLSQAPTGTHFGFGGRIRSHRPEAHQPIIDLIEMRFEPRHLAIHAPLPDPIRYTGIWQHEGQLYRYRATLRRKHHHAGALETSVVFTPNLTAGSKTDPGESLLDKGYLVVEFNSAGLDTEPASLASLMAAFRNALPALLQTRSEGILRTGVEKIRLPIAIDEARAVTEPAPPSDAVRISRKPMQPTPAVLAYNLGHFFAGSNAADWWTYSGATGGRIFVSPAHIEGTRGQHRPAGDFEVHGKDDFLAFRERLSHNPTDPHLVHWERLVQRMVEVPLLSNNRIHVAHALEHFSKHSPDVLIQASMVPEIFPIENADDWNGKWRLWRSYFSMVYYYASKFGIQRFAMHNEPNHPHMFIEPEDWLVRAALCADAAARAIEVVNREQQSALQAKLFVPVTAGDIGDPFTGPYVRYGRPILERWDLDFLGNRTGNPLYANYAVQRYNATPENFGRGLLDLKNKVAEDLPWHLPMPSFSITEFNVHHGRFFDTIEESLDTPEKFIHFAQILTHLMRAGLEEYYVFKFGLTAAMPGRQFLVHKNGMFHTDNEREPHNYGGPTRAAEAYRLFIQAFAPGRQLLKTQALPAPEALDITAAIDPESDALWIFSVNPHPAPQPLNLDLQAWAHDREGSVIVSEVSAGKEGEIVLWETLASDGRLQLKQPAQSVWLLRLPAAKKNSQWQEIQADTSVMVVDDPAKQRNQAKTVALHVANPLDPEQARAVAIYAFTLPEFAANELQTAVLTLAGMADGLDDQPAQAQVFIVEDAEWDPNSIQWSNTPALRADVPRGHFIRHRVVDNASGSARVAGQINLSHREPQTIQLDLTRALQKNGGQRITLLIAQEPRWDVHPSEKEAKGDIQAHGIQLAPATAKPPHTPRVQLLLNRP